MTEKYLATINEFLYKKNFYYSPSCEGFYSHSQKVIFHVSPVRRYDAKVWVHVSLWNAKLGRYISNLYSIKASDHGFTQRFEKKIYLPTMEAYAKQDAENQRYYDSLKQAS